EIGDRLADAGMQPLGQLGDLDWRLDADRASVGDGGIRGDGHDFYNAWCTPGMTQTVYRRPSWPVSVRPSMGPAAGSRSAPSWPWLFTSPDSATTPAAGSSSAACPRAAATSSPLPSCR